MHNVLIRKGLKTGIVRQDKTHWATSSSQIFQLHKFSTLKSHLLHFYIDLPLLYGLPLCLLPVLLLHFLEPLPVHLHLLGQSACPHISFFHQLLGGQRCLSALFLTFFANLKLMTGYKKQFASHYYSCHMSMLRRSDLNTRNKTGLFGTVWHFCKPSKLILNKDWYIHHPTILGTYLLQLLQAFLPCICLLFGSFRNLLLTHAHPNAAPLVSNLFWSQSLGLYRFRGRLVLKVVEDSLVWLFSK